MGRIERALISLPRVSVISGDIVFEKPDVAAERSAVIAMNEENRVQIIVHHKLIRAVSINGENVR